MTEIIFCMGQSSVGKSYYAQRYALTNPEFEHLSFDTCWNYSANNQKAMDGFLRKFIPKIKKGSVIVDGINAPKWTIDILKEHLPDIKISLFYIYTDSRTLCMKQKLNPRKQRNLKQIEETYHRHNEMLDGIDNIRYIYNDYDKFVQFNKTYFNKFLDDIKKFDMEAFKLDIELYHNVKIKDEWHGKDPYTPHTYKTLQDNIHFKGKSVLDLGSYYGTYSYLAKEMGAKEVVGIERNEPAIMIAERINELNGSDMKFLFGDAEDIKVDRRFDVVMILNMLHHNKYPERTLDIYFGLSDETVVLEVEMPNEERRERFPHFNYVSKERISEIGKKNGFILKSDLESIRPFRKILVYQKK